MYLLGTLQAGQLAAEPITSSSFAVPSNPKGAGTPPVPFSTA